MRNRWLLNLLLLASVGLLGWLAFSEAPKVVNRLSDIDPLSITHMRIQQAKQPPIELEKIGQQWHMRTPYQVPANNSHINRLLSIMETPVRAQFSADRELAQYGLDNPEVRISMNNELHISLGNVEPLGNRRYVRIADSIYVIGDSPFAQLSAAASLLVDTALFSGEDHIQSIQLPGNRLEKMADGSWQLTPAVDLSADTLNAFVDHWKHARAVYVSDPDQAANGEQRVVVTLSDKRVFEYDIVDLNTGVTLVNRQNGLHYHFAEDVGKQLLSLPGAPAGPDA